MEYYRAKMCCYLLKNKKNLRFLEKSELKQEFEEGIKELEKFNELDIFVDYLKELKRAFYNM